jgi:hypothetical protein
MRNAAWRAAYAALHGRAPRMRSACPAMRPVHCASAYCACRMGKVREITGRRL